MQALSAVVRAGLSEEKILKEGAQKGHPAEYRSAHKLSWHTRKSREAGAAGGESDKQSGGEM